jgi:hypothetical protein
VPNANIGTPKIVGLDQQSAQRGTVEHRVYKGDDAKAFLDGAKLEIHVSCREDGGKLIDRIPYPIAASLEVAQASQIAVYQEISARIRPRVEVLAE